ncbi:MAG: molybdate ABC transporter permease subunit [Actinomycetota bacterium]
MDWQAIWLTAKLATATTIILLVLGMPLAYWLALSRRRWKTIIEAIVALPLILPPTVLGFYTLLAIGSRSPVGRAYESVTGGLLPFSFEGLLVGSVAFSLPFAVQPMMVAFGEVDKKLIEASWILGEGRLSTFFRTIAPMSTTGIMISAVLTFAHTMGEFGVVLMLGGNIPGETRTVAVSIYDSVQALDYSAAGRTSAFLLAVSFLVLVITYSLQKRMGGVWPAR